MRTTEAWKLSERIGRCGPDDAATMMGEAIRRTRTDGFDGIVRGAAALLADPAHGTPAMAAAVVGAVSAASHDRRHPAREAIVDLLADPAVMAAVDDRGTRRRAAAILAEEGLDYLHPIDRARAAAAAWDDADGTGARIGVRRAIRSMGSPGGIAAVRTGIASAGAWADIAARIADGRLASMDAAPMLGACLMAADDDGGSGVADHAASIAAAVLDGGPPKEIRRRAMLALATAGSPIAVSLATMASERVDAACDGRGGIAERIIRRAAAGIGSGIQRAIRSVTPSTGTAKR